MAWWPVFLRQGQELSRPSNCWMALCRPVLRKPHLTWVVQENRNESKGRRIALTSNIVNEGKAIER